MMQRSQRLKRARIAAGFTSASAAARRLGISVPTYSAHENGGRAFSVEDATIYAKRFGVSLEWLLTGQGGQEIRSEAIRGTPIIGAISPSAWEERGPIDVRSPTHLDTLEIAILAGGSEAYWFAVSTVNAWDWLGCASGDYLLTREVSEPQPNAICICERSGFDGKLRQLVPAQFLQIDGDWTLVIRSSQPDIDGKPLGESGRLLGQVESLYRAL